eukprot:12715658-Ditylum_brightwellii.AAC.1
MLPVPGSFRSFPKEMLKNPKIQGNNFLEELVFDSLKLDWEMACKVVRSSITHCPWVADSQRMFKKMKEYKIVYTKKREDVIHLALRQRMMELFSVNGLEAPHRKRNVMIFTCCGKVSLVNNFGQHIIGYVMSEDNHSFVVLLENDILINVEHPTFDSELGCYEYNNQQRSRDYTTSQYWPIFFKDELLRQYFLHLELCCLEK